MAIPLPKDKDDSTRLGLMQDGIDVRNAPQVRLLSHELTPENGVMIIANTTMDQNDIYFIEGEVDLLIQKARMQFRIK